MLQLHLDSGRMNGRFCDFAVEEFACASVRHQNISGVEVHLLKYCTVWRFFYFTQVFSFSATNTSTPLHFTRKYCRDNFTPIHLFDTLLSLVTFILKKQTKQHMICSWAKMVQPTRMGLAAAS